MEQSNIPDGEKAIHDLNNIIFLHVANPESLPVGIKYINIVEIDNYEKQSINHIMIQDLLDFYTDTNIENILKLILEKIKVGGKLEIQGPDLNQFCIAVSGHDIDLDTAKKILYSSKKNIHTIYEIEDLLKSNNCKIISKKYTNIFEYHIISEKYE